MKKVFMTMLIIVLIVGTAVYYVFGSTDDKTTVAQALQNIKEKEELPIVGSYEKLKSLLKKAEKNQFTKSDAVMEKAMESTGVNTMSAETTTGAMPAADSGTQDFSTTNVQVQGVDEADVVKTDGEYIYQVNYDRVVIVKAQPSDSMSIVNQVRFKGQQFVPREIYVDDQYLVVIGSGDYYSTYIESTTSNMTTESYPSKHGSNRVKAYIYNIEDKENITEVRELEVEGYYLSSRKVGSSVYLVANQYLNTYSILHDDREVAPPLYKDSKINEEEQFLDYNEIHYFPDSVEANYLLVAGFDLNHMDKEMNVSAYLGSGHNIYASAEHLYVAVTQYQPQGSIISKLLKRPETIDKTTSIYQFQLNEGLIDFLGQGEVPGQILNQFSMDEYQGHFRIATTTGEVWREDQFTSKNNLYVLDQDLNTVGKIEDIAPGEKIYSVRFMGDRGYMVTFRTVDPLFVIDLKHPEKPEILGKLKIPGYSDYLHPYDENHIIGFGKEAVEVGTEYGDTMAYYQGMKVALFDITDVHHPKEKFGEHIGDRGTDSELLYNHKALLFSKEKNLLAFPVSLMEVKSKAKDPKDAAHQYGEFTFQGAYIYSLDLEKGFQLKKRITHISPEEYKKTGTHWYNSDKNVERLLYIGDNLYTLSKSYIMAHQSSTLQDISTVEIPKSKQQDK